MERVMVIGSPGAGKSTFARTLADRIDLPLKHLDAEYWHPGWLEPPDGQWDAKLADMVAGTRWIIDGNYGSSLAVRLARADTVVWLDYSTSLCLWRAVRRIVTYRGTIRPDAAPGCPERFDAAFVLYIAAFRRAKRPKTVRILEKFAGKVVRFTTPSEAARWLAAQPESPGLAA